LRGPGILVEWSLLGVRRTAIAGARLVANPGCFAGHIVASYKSRSGGGVEQGSQNINQGCFTGAVGSKQTDDFALGNIDRESLRRRWAYDATAIAEACRSALNLSAPDLVLSVHDEYIRQAPML
jgi:hypothetical protein